MRLKSLKFPNVLCTKYGLRPVDLKSLGSCVALVGRNGAGKSRFLSALGILLRTRGPALIREAQLNAAEYEAKVNRLSGNHNLDAELLKAIGAPVPTIPRLKQNRIVVRTSGNRPVLHDPEPERAVLMLTKELSRRVILLDPYSLRMETPAPEEDKKTFDRVLRSAGKDQDPRADIDAVRTGGLEFIRRLMNEMALELYNHLRNPSAAEGTQPFQRFAKLQKMIRLCLGKELEWSPDSRAGAVMPAGVTGLKGSFTLGNYPLSYEQLSPGEQILLHYALLFFAVEENNINVQECIFLIDEFDSQLHPSVQISLVDALRRITNDHGQIFLATHSPSVIAHLGYDEIFLMADGAIVPPSRTTPSASLKELFAVDENIEKLTELLTSSASWAAAHFISQCLEKPTVVTDGSPFDPQYQIAKPLLFTNPIRASLLDYGAGKGRLHTILQQDGRLRDLTYGAFELDPECQVDLRSKGISNVYTSLDEIPDTSFDTVLFLNVLHEIHPNKWQRLFADVSRKLKPDGRIVIVEDKQMPRGEQAHEAGFLLLSEESAPKLSPRGACYVTSTRQDRFLAVSFDANFASGISDDGIKKSIEQVRAESLEKIKELRANPHPKGDLSQGRLFGLHTQLVVNAELLLMDMK